MLFFSFSKRLGARPRATKLESKTLLRPSAPPLLSEGVAGSRSGCKLLRSGPKRMRAQPQRPSWPLGPTRQGKSPNDKSPRILPLPVAPCLTLSRAARDVRIHNHNLKTTPAAAAGPVAVLHAGPRPTHCHCALWPRAAARPGARVRRPSHGSHNSGASRRTFYRHSAVVAGLVQRIV